MDNEKLKIVKDERTEPGLNQRSTLLPILTDLYKEGRVSVEANWGLLDKISLKQYKFILALIFNRNYTKLNEVLGNIK